MVYMISIHNAYMSLRSRAVSNINFEEEWRLANLKVNHSMADVRERLSRILEEKTRIIT